jgi:predicted nucleic acid-binding Zn finger protein
MNNIKQLGTGLFEVQGETGIYEVCVLGDYFSCTCNSFRFKNTKGGEFCKHIEIVLKSLEVEK